MCYKIGIKASASAHTLRISVSVCSLSGIPEVSPAGALQPQILHVDTR